MSAFFGQLLSALKKMSRHENVGTNDNFFLQLNGLLPGHKGTRKFLKAVLLSYYFTYSPHARSEIMKRFVTSKVIIKITDIVFCLPCFK